MTPVNPAAGADRPSRSRLGRFLRSTRGRASLVAAGVLVVALAVADAGMILAWNTLSDRTSDGSLLEQTQVVTTKFVASGRHLTSADIPLATHDGVPLDTVIVDPAGQALVQTAEQAIPGSTLLALAAAARTERFHWAHVESATGAERSTYSTRLDDAGDVLVVSYSETEDNDLLTTTILLVSLLSVLLIAIGAVLSYRLAGLALGPVHRLAGLARTISERDLHQRVNGGVPDDELGELVTTFNAMLARLETAFEAQRIFTADASHELRAPIAVMRLELERGLSRARSAAEYREVLRWVQEDVDHLGRIVEQLLLLTRADAGMLRPAMEPVDAEDLLSEAAARWTDSASAKGVSIQLDLAARGPISADPTLLRRVVYNLLDNAIRHAPAGSVVRLRASRTGGGLDVEVDDQGPGVAPEFRPRLFSRFGRADGARSGTGAGIGLGLALGAAIARAHGGWLELVDRDGPGAAFKLHLPNASPAQAAAP
jgi:two-component system OmpR family sensor kinase